MKNQIVKMNLLAVLVSISVVAQAGDTVVINGYLLAPMEVQQLERQLGYRVLPGNYAADFQTGCWVNIESGQGNCQSQDQAQSQSQNGSSGAYTSRWGSGEQYSNGSWSHYDSLTGNGGVGGTADGCVYAFGWSNC